MTANRVRDIFVARVEGLMAQYRESEFIEHSSTIGAMREQYLKDFVKELLPPKFSPVSGFIADMEGHITPQLDMIFFDPSELPTLSLVGDASIVPFEIALISVEVKSVLQKRDLAQIRRQREAIGQMESQFWGVSWDGTLPDSRDRKNRIGMFVIAFECEMSEKTLKQWVAEELEQPGGVCVLQDSGEMLSILNWLPGPEPELTVVRSTKTDPYDPLLTFVAVLYRSLDLLSIYNSLASNNGRTRPRNMWFWEGYLSEYLYKRSSEKAGSS